MTAIITRTDTLASDNGSSSVKGSTLTWTELDRNFYPIKLTTDGTAEAGKALVLDANKDFTGVRHGTFTGTVQAEQITSTDDMSVADDLTVAGNIIMSGAGSITGSASVPETYSTGNLSLSTTKQTKAHGLSGTPQVCCAYLVCQTAELDYAIGDYVWINPNLNDKDEGSGTSSNGFSISADSTNIYVRVSGSTSRIAIGQQDSGDPSNITASRWRIVVFAQYFA